MSTQSVHMVSTQVADKAVLTLIINPTISLTTAPGPLGALKLALISVLNGGATKDQIWANITVPAYDTYAPSATIVWTTILNETDGSVTTFSPQFLFSQTGATGATIIGAALYLPGSPNVLYGLGVFGTPINFARAGDGFVINAAWNQGANSTNFEFNVDY